MSKTTSKSSPIKRKCTNCTPRKRILSSGILSTKSIIEELNEMESFILEDLLRSVKTLEDSLQDLPSIDDTLADIERLSEQIKKDQEVYLNE